MDDVDALARLLGGAVAAIVDDINIVAEAAGHGVAAEAAIEEVVAIIAGECVGGAVARAGDVRRAGEDEVLEVGAEHVGDGARDCVGAAAGKLGDDIARVIDHIVIVARAARHLIGAGAAVDEVRGGIAEDDVIERVAGAVDRVGAG